jgi:N-acetylneuraminic acid mutarotase
MKQGLLLSFFALSLFITSCGSDSDKDGNWTKRSDYRGAGRGGAVSFTIGDNVYVGSGYSDGDYFSSFYKYNALGDNWSSATALPAEAPLRREAVAFSVNGKGYVGLGINDNNERLDDFWEFDPETETWTELTGDAKFLGTARQGAVALAFDTDNDGLNDVAYVGTGYGFLDGDDRNYLGDFYKFDGTKWLNEDEAKGFPGSKSAEGTTFVIGTKGYLVSGTNNLDNVWEFDAKTETWDQKKDIDKDNHAENVQRTNAVAFVIDGLAYVTTGSGTDAREVWEYKPSKDDWIERNDLENEVASRVDAIGISIGGRGFITTGSSGIYGLSDTWEFTPGVKEDDDDND